MNVVYCCPKMRRALHDRFGGVEPDFAAPSLLFAVPQKGCLTVQTPKAFEDSKDFIGVNQGMVVIGQDNPGDETRGLRGEGLQERLREGCDAVGGMTDVGDVLVTGGGDQVVVAAGATVAGTVQGLLLKLSQAKRLMSLLRGQSAPAAHGASEIARAGGCQGWSQGFRRSLRMGLWVRRLRGLVGGDWGWGFDGRASGGEGLGGWVRAGGVFNDRLKALLQRGRRGFVLLEIVMALGLFALVAVGMTQALDQIAQTSKLGRQEAQLIRALDSALAQVVHLPEFKKSSYTFPESDDGIEAKASIERVELYTQEKALLDKMYRVQVEAWIKDGTEIVLQRGIETYVYSPQSSL